MKGLNLMYNSKKNWFEKRAQQVLYCTLFASMLIASSCEAYPYFLRRLIFWKGLHRQKIVDLIFDNHGIEIGTKQYQMGQAEQALFDELKKIGNASYGETVEYIAETSTEEMRNQKGAKIFNRELHREFGNSQDKKLVYTNGDCYRTFIKPACFPVVRAMLIDPKLCITQLEEALLVLKQHAEPEIFQGVFDLWKEYMSKMRLQNHSWNGLTDARIIYYQLMDFEILIKLLMPNYRHSIVYAGGAHCNNLGEWLSEKLNFTEINQMGRNDLEKQLTFAAELMAKNTSEVEMDTEIQLCWPPLPAKTWQNLRVNSVARYNQD
jgi:hypothetical protein